MKIMRPQGGFRRSEMVAYGCVGSAILFIVALTFGALDSPEHPKYLASNLTGPAAVSSP